MHIVGGRPVLLAGAASIRLAQPEIAVAPRSHSSRWQAATRSHSALPGDYRIARGTLLDNVRANGSDGAHQCPAGKGSAGKAGFRWARDFGRNAVDGKW